MRSSELVRAVPMSRVAVVVPAVHRRAGLVAVADAGTLEPVGAFPAPEGEPVEALRRLGGERAAPKLLREAPDVDLLERDARRDLLAGEVELRRCEGLLRTHGSFDVLVGWMPSEQVPEVQGGLEQAGGSLVELPQPRWSDPPTLYRPAPVARAFRPLVTTYGAAPYADIDPTPFAAISFVLMFGMMFGDVGHGLVLSALGLAVRRGRPRFLAPFQQVWPLPVAAGLVAAVFGLLYGDAFGPTGLVPRVWLDPVDRPEPLLVAAIAVGAVLLAVGHVYGIVNRRRERGTVTALLSPTGAAGLSVLVGMLLAALGWYVGAAPVMWGGAAVAGAGAVLLATGFLLSAGGGAAGAAEAAVELVDALVRVGSNLLSFTRLAAFGLMHAALGAVVFDAAAALWGGPGVVAAALVFLVGNAIAFSLELLVTGVQALRLEFYELFSRIFVSPGHVFAPWSVPVVAAKEES